MVRMVPRPPGRRRWLLLAVVGLWVLLWFPLRGRHTLDLPTSRLTPMHRSLNEVRATLDRNRGADSPLTWLVDLLREGFDQLVLAAQALVSQPALGRPVPVIGWLGVVALAVLAGYAAGTARLAVLAGLGCYTLGALGLWQQSLDTLAFTLVAVLVCALIGIPLGVWIGLSPRLERLVVPVLDLMQTMPTFVYLAPLTLLFLIGPASAVIATVIYAAPPVIRITAHGIRGVAGSALEAGISLGATRWQLLRTIQLPMARRTIVLGLNQTTMCALSMVTIAALIDAPGLGRSVVNALASLDVGAAFRSGLAIVVLAIVLDRVTGAAATAGEVRQRSGGERARRVRRRVLRALVPITAIALYLSHTFVWAAVFPSGGSGAGPGYPGAMTGRGWLGAPIEDGVNAATAWLQLNLAGATGATKDAVTYGLLNPLQALLCDAPWYLAAAGILGVVWIVAGRSCALLGAGCLGLVIATGLWQETLATLAATLVATALVLAIGLVLGVAMGRRDGLDRLVRPVLDAGQVMPAFVYLVPILGLFGATRFTAIIAAVVFAAPVAVKLIADGVRGVPPAAVEAAVAFGARSLQTITKVQIPLAGRAVALAANQGLIYVLSMVVVGGLVGAGGLGYLVVAGFSQTNQYGKGLAAGLAIVLLGVLLDRATQAAARRMVVRRRERQDR